MKVTCVKGEIVETWNFKNAAYKQFLLVGHDLLEDSRLLQVRFLTFKDVLSSLFKFYFLVFLLFHYVSTTEGTAISSYSIILYIMNQCQTWNKKTHPAIFFASFLISVVASFPSEGKSFDWNRQL